MCSANPRFGGGGGGSVDRFCCGRCNWFGAEFDGGGGDGVLGCTKYDSTVEEAWSFWFSWCGLEQWT